MNRRIPALMLALCLVLLLGLSACGKKSGSAGEVNVYNWGEYIDESIFEDFENETGIKVNYNTYVSNEVLYANLRSGGGGYDVIIPSDYMIARLMSEDMLETLDYGQIPNAENVNLKDFAFSDVSYDPDGTYSIPYMWGTVGLIYDSSVVTGDVDSWGILFDEQYKGEILMFDNPRDALGIALKYLGYSQNTEDASEITEAMDLLIDQKERGLVQAYVMDQIFEKLESGEAAIGPYYAGDYLTMVEENPNLRFCVPKEGSNIFVDAMCVPKGASNYDNAMAFINFMCEPEIIARNSEVTGYSVPSRAAWDLLDEELQTSTVAYPPEDVIARCETFKLLGGDTLALYDSEWTRLGMARSGSK